MIRRFQGCLLFSVAIGTLLAIHGAAFGQTGLEVTTRISLFGFGDEVNVGYRAVLSNSGTVAVVAVDSEFQPHSPTWPWLYRRTGGASSAIVRTVIGAQPDIGDPEYWIAEFPPEDIWVSPDGQTVLYAANIYGEDRTAYTPNAIMKRASEALSELISYRFHLITNEPWDKTIMVLEVSGSADGRYVAFESGFADNILPNDPLTPSPSTFHRRHVYVHDTQTGERQRISVSPSGSAGEADSWHAAMSANGRYVAFTSEDSGLIGFNFEDANEKWDVFVRDLDTDTTIRVSVSSSGQEANDHSSFPSISANGRFVSFWSKATNLIDGDTSPSGLVYVHDRDADGNGVYDEPNGIATHIVNIGVHENISGCAGDMIFYQERRHRISGSGRYVVFTCGLEDNTTQIYVRDLYHGSTTQESVGLGGAAPNGWLSHSPAIAADGRAVAFTSDSSNLVPNDTNNAADCFMRTKCTADFNGDGVVTSSDLSAFITVWLTGHWAADFNGDGVVNSTDTSAMIAAFLAGC